MGICRENERIAGVNAAKLFKMDLKSYDLLISPPFQLIEGYLSLTVFLN